jgi:Zn finger protein HypA/HybF involved in hydrogenase expression
MSVKPRDTQARCPKCRSRDFTVTYVDECVASNTVKDGRWVGVFEESAMPTRKGAYGSCPKCKHEWRFRNGWID